MDAVLACKSSAVQDTSISLRFVVNEHHQSELCYHLPLSTGYVDIQWLQYKAAQWPIFQDKLGRLAMASESGALQQPTCAPVASE